MPLRYGHEPKIEENSEYLELKQEQADFDSGHMKFDNIVYEQLYDERFDCSELYERLEDKLFADGDLIKDPAFLDSISKLSPLQRVVLLTQSARKAYISPNDFSEYFLRYPADAELVIATCLDDIQIGNMPEFTAHQLKCKVFEAAANTIPGYWDAFQNSVTEDRYPTKNNQWPSLLEISSRSKLARDHLLADYKTTLTTRFAQFGDELNKILIDFLNRAEDIRDLQDWGYVNFEEEILYDSSYKILSDDKKAAFLEDLIAYCHNAVVFHEVYNSYFSERNKIATPQPYGRGEHSILFETDHEEHSFQLPKYNSFKVNEWDDSIPHDTQGYEKIIEACIRELGHIGTSNDIQPILEFWDKNRDPSYGPDIAKTISMLGTAEATGLILERLREAKSLDRRRLLSLLFRLELGKIGISEQGLEYLGRKFDLGEHNNPNYFVHRLTADGKIGVFDEGRQLLGLAQIEAEDFDDQSNSIIRKTVLDITSEMLFTETPDDTPEEAQARLNLIDEFKANYFDVYLGMFSENSELRFNNLELKEQGWVLNFLHRSDEEQKERFFNFISEFGEDGFRAFRSMEFGEEMAGKIISISEQINTQTAKLIFDKYQTIVELSDRLIEFISKSLGDNQLEEANLQKIKINLLKRGKELISRYAESAPDDETVRRELEDMEEEVLLLAEIFRSTSNKTFLEKNEKMSLEDFNTRIEIMAGSDISKNPDIEQELIRIFNLNWDNPESEQAYPYMLEDLQRALKNPHQRFYLIRHGSEIIGFQRFSRYGAGEVYAASNNIRKSAQNVGIGALAQEQILAREASQNRIVMHAYIEGKATSHYFSDDHFVAVAMEQYRDTGDLDFLMVRDDRVDCNYHYQSCDYQTISSDYAHDKAAPGSKIVQLDLGDKAGLYATIAEQTHQGMVITAFFRQQQHPNLALLAFEPSQLNNASKLAESDKAA